MNITKVFGPPGTGKTTTLLALVENYIAKGIPTDEIAYLSFTTKAADEARQRAIDKFEIDADKLPYFRTIHSLCFKELSLSTKQIIKKDDYIKICEKLGVQYSGFFVMDEGQLVAGAEEGDRMLFNEGLARVRQISYINQYNLSDENYSYEEFSRFCATLLQYKDTFSLLDFNDMLELFLKRSVCPSFKVLFVDEAQDLSSLQWKIVDALVNASKEVFIAGDDDQAIFKWAGASPELFVSYPGRNVVLDQTYRLPADVHELSQKFISQIPVGHRVHKEFLPTTKPGKVIYDAHIDEIEEHMLDIDAGSWLILARNQYLLRSFEALCERVGFAYMSKSSPLNKSFGYVDAILMYQKLLSGATLTDVQREQVSKYCSHLDRKINENLVWYEALNKLGESVKDYFRLLLARGESLSKTPRIVLTTIHGAKGGEADNVVVIQDMSYRSYREYQENSFYDEVRVFYVAITRTKKNLYLLVPNTNNHVSIY